MKSRWQWVVLVGCLFPLTSAAQQPRSQEDDEAAIRAAVVSYVDAYNRRDANGLIKDVEGVPEDQMHRELKKIQDLTDETIAKLDAMAAEKEAEILKV